MAVFNLVLTAFILIVGMPVWATECDEALSSVEAYSHAIRELAKGRQDLVDKRVRNEPAIVIRVTEKALNQSYEDLKEKVGALALDKALDEEDRKLGNLNNVNQNQRTATRLQQIADEVQSHRAGKLTDTENIFNNIHLQSMTVSPDGQLIAFFIHDKYKPNRVLHIVDAAQKKVILTEEVGGFQDDSKGLAFSPDSQKIAVASGNLGESKIEIRSVAKLEVLQTFTLPEQVDELTYSPDGNFIAIASATKTKDQTSYNYKSQVISLATGNVVFNFDLGPQLITFSKDGQHMLVTENARKEKADIKVYNLLNKKLMLRLKKSGFKQAAFTYDNQSIYVLSADESGPAFWSLKRKPMFKALSLIQTPPSADAVLENVEASRMLYSFDGTKLFIVHYNQLSVYEADTFEIDRFIKLQDITPYAFDMAVSPIANQVVVSYQSRTGWLHDLDSGKKRALKDYGDRFFSFALGGKMILTRGTWERGLRFWEWKTRADQAIEDGE